jgi:hypothetical protein
LALGHEEGERQKEDTVEHHNLHHETILRWEDTMILGLGMEHLKGAIELLSNQQDKQWQHDQLLDEPRRHSGSN